MTFSGRPFTNGVRSAALSPDGTLLAALVWDSPDPNSALFLRLVRVSDGQTVGEIESVQSYGELPQFSADGKILATSSLVLAVPTLQPLRLSPLQSSGMMTLTRDGTFVAQGGHVLKVATGGTVFTSQAPGQVEAMAFSPDGATYAELRSGAGAPTLNLWRTSDWTAIGAADIDYGPDGVALIEGPIFFTGDGKRVLVKLRQGLPSPNDAAIYSVLSVPDIKFQVAVAETQPFWDGPVVFAPDGSFVAARLAITTGIWRGADLSSVSRLNEGSNRLAFLGNGTLTAFGGTMYDPTTGASAGMISTVWSGVSPDGRLVITPYDVTVVRLADLSKQATLDDPGVRSMDPALFTRDNRFAAVAGTDTDGNGKLFVFDTSTGKVLANIPEAGPLAVTTTASGAVRVAGFQTSPNAIRVWSVPDGKVLVDVPDVNVPDARVADFSPDGSLVAVAKGTSILIINTETGVVRQTLSAHYDALNQGYGVTSLAFSPTGQLATVGTDQTLRLWCSP